MADQARVFVSHHHSPEEDAFTARLVADLEAAGADVWVDTSGITSDDFIKKIDDGLIGRQWLVLAMNSRCPTLSVGRKGHENPNGSMFCDECGERVVLLNRGSGLFHPEVTLLK